MSTNDKVSDTPACTTLENGIDSNDCRAWRTLAYRLESELGEARECITHMDSSVSAGNATLTVRLGEMHESNGRVTWTVMLARSEDCEPWDCHQVYSDSIKGRAEYEAAKLRHFLGQGPEPDLLAFDTAAHSATRRSLPVDDLMIANAQVAKEMGKPYVVLTIAPDAILNGIEGQSDAERELANIANAERFNRERFRDDTEFADWAQSRCKAMLRRADRGAA